MIAIIPIGICVFYLFSGKKHNKIPLIVSIISVVLIMTFQLYIHIGNSSFLYNSTLKETIIPSEKYDNLEENYFINSQNNLYAKTDEGTRSIFTLNYNLEYVDTVDDSRIEIYENTFKNKLLYLAFDIPDKLIVYDINTEPLKKLSFVEATLKKFLRVSSPTYNLF